jgi:hypothetical protein
MPLDQVNRSSPCLQGGILTESMSPQNSHDKWSNRVREELDFETRRPVLGIERLVLTDPLGGVGS